MTLETLLIGTGAGLPDIDLRNIRHAITPGGIVVPNANGDIPLPLLIQGEHPADAMDAFQSIAEMLTAAERLANSASSSWVELRDQTHQSRYATWGIKGGEIVPTSTHIGMHSFIALLTLTVMDKSSYGQRSDTLTSATLDNGSASILLSATRGNDPALPRIILRRQGGVSIPGYRLSSRPVPAGLVDPANIGAAWIPLIDLVAAGGTSAAHAGSIGGARINGTLTAHDVWAPIAGASQGADTLSAGKYHTYTGVADVPTTPTVAAPTALAGTVTDRAIVSDADVSTTVWTAPTIGESGSDNSLAIPDATGDVTLSAAFDAMPTTGTTRWAVVSASRAPNGLAMAGNGRPTVSAGWSLMNEMHTDDGTTDPVNWLWVYIMRNAVAGNDAQTFTIHHDADSGTGTWQCAVAMVEVLGTPAVGSIVDVVDILEDNSAPLTTPRYTLSRSTRFPAELILVGFGSDAAAVAQYNHYGTGYEEIVESPPVAIAAVTAGAAETGTFTATAVNPSGSNFAAAAVSFIGTSVTTVTATETLDSNIPGNLQAGSVTAVVQAQDVYGNLSAPTSVATDTVLRDGGRVDYTWTGSADAFVVSWGLNGQFRQATVYGNAFTLTDMTQGAAILALPTTSSITTPRTRFRLRVGTVEAQYDIGYTFESPFGATAGTVYSGTVELGLSQPMDGTRPEWGVVVEASGIGTARVDAIWLQSAERGASSARIEALDDVANVTYYELRPDGVIVCYMESVDGTLQYPARAVGNLLIPPGDSILTIQALGTGDPDKQIQAHLMDLDRHFTVEIDYLPRYRWLAGGG